MKKNYSLFLLLILSLFLIECRSEDYYSRNFGNSQEKISLRTVDKKEIPQIINFIESNTLNYKLPLQHHNGLGRAETIFGEIDTGYILESINERNDTYYVFVIVPTISNNEGITYNLEVKSENSNPETAKIIVYYPAEDWIINGNDDFSIFSGTAYTYSLNGDLETSVQYVMGAAGPCDPNPCTDCPPGGGGSGGGGGGPIGGGPPVGGGPTGDGGPSGDGGPPGDDGSSGDGGSTGGGGGCGPWVVIKDEQGNIIGMTNGCDVYYFPRPAGRLVNPCGGGNVVVAPQTEPCKTSKEDLKAMFPNASNTNMQILADVINQYGKDFGIDSKEKLQHFLSQVGHETGGFTTLNVTENMNYSTPKYIVASYPSKFTMDITAEPNKKYAGDYIGNPQALANVAMCCNFGNGDEASGDGWKFRGRGIVQLTWKENYQKFQTWYNNKYDPDLDFIENPDLISSTPELSIISGLWFYKTKVLNKIAVNTTTTVEKVTSKINGIAKKGLKDRKQRFQAAQNSIICK